ncbi:hypothetical protein HY489_05295 [Candidatus Woesearchaeota archaeon]|nr:hypothetical protein [Candidatus Woesearchaeota archaeon]
MLNFVFDADGLIKLARSGVLSAIIAFAKCAIPEQVYQEVMKGKEKMYEDAFVIERLIEEKSIKVVKIASSDAGGLGQGERSVLALAKKSRFDAVISDDQKFLKVLESEGISYVIPTDMIAVMAMKRRLTKAQAHEALDAIRPFVRESNYLAAKEMIGGG